MCTWDNSVVSQPGRRALAPYVVVMLAHIPVEQAWHEIFEANKDQISNPDIIHPGQVVKIPSHG